MVNSRITSLMERDMKKPNNLNTMENSKKARKMVEEK